MSSPGSPDPILLSDSMEADLDTGAGENESLTTFFQNNDLCSLLMRAKFTTLARLQAGCVIDFLTKPSTVRLLFEIAFVLPCEDDYVKHFLLIEAFANSRDRTSFEVHEAVIEDIQRPLAEQLNQYTSLTRAERTDISETAIDILHSIITSIGVTDVIRDSCLLQRYPFAVISGRNCFPVARSLEDVSIKRRTPLQVCRNFARMIRSFCTQQGASELLLDILEESARNVASRHNNPTQSGIDTWNYLTAWLSNADNSDIMGSLVSLVVDSYAVLPQPGKRRLTAVLSELHFGKTLCHFLITPDIRDVPVDAGLAVSEALNAILFAVTAEELQMEIISCLPDLAESVFVSDHHNMDALRAKYAGRTLVAGVLFIVYTSRTLYEDTYGKAPSAVSRELKKLGVLKSWFRKVMDKIKDAAHRLKVLVRESVGQAMQGKQGVHHSVNLSQSQTVRPTHASHASKTQEAGPFYSLAVAVMESLADLNPAITKSIVVESDEYAVQLKGDIPSPEHHQPVRWPAGAGDPDAPVARFSMLQYAILETLGRLLLISANLRDLLSVSKNTNPYMSLTGVLNVDDLLRDGGLASQNNAPFPNSAIAGVGGADVLDLKKTFNFQKGGHYPISPLHIAECYAKSGIPDAVLLTMMAYPGSSICHFLGTRIIVPMLEYNGHAPHVIHSVISETCLFRFLDLYSGHNMSDIATSFTLSTTSVGAFIVSIAANIIRIAGGVPDGRWQTRKLDHLTSLRSSVALSSPTQSIAVPLTFDDLISAVKVANNANNTILQKVANNSRFKAFSDKVLRVSTWTHFMFHESEDLFEFMLRRNRSPSPCVEPPASPLKPALRESLLTLKGVSDKRHHGKAIPVLPSGQAVQKGYTYSIRSSEEREIPHVGHYVTRPVLGSLQSTNKRAMMLPTSAVQTSDNKLTNRMPRASSYGSTLADRPQMSLRSGAPSHMVQLGAGTMQRGSIHCFSILRPADCGRDESGAAAANTAARSAVPLMSIRAFKSTMSGGH